MTLSKMEIQQMLREMNVKFRIDDSYETLKQRLQAENHSLWLKSVSGTHATAGETETIRVKKRKTAVSHQNQAEDPAGASVKSEASENPRKRSGREQEDRSESAYRPPIEKPKPGKPWKAAAEGTEPFNRKRHVFDTVLRRAKMCCERCGIRSGRDNPAVRLEPYHLLPLPQGGEHSIKNVVALCPACMEAMKKTPSARAIKDLKRKTRTKLYNSLQVVKKRSRRRPRPAPHRGK
jgi:5-methylcytosine-specific restriction enzyme A